VTGAGRVRLAASGVNRQAWTREGAAGTSDCDTDVAVAGGDLVISKVSLYCSSSP